MTIPDLCAVMLEDTDSRLPALLDGMGHMGPRWLDLAELSGAELYRAWWQPALATHAWSTREGELVGVSQVLSPSFRDGHAQVFAAASWMEPRPVWDEIIEYAFRIWGFRKLYTSVWQDAAHLLVEAGWIEEAMLSQSYVTRQGEDRSVSILAYYS